MIFARSIPLSFAILWRLLLVLPLWLVIYALMSIVIFVVAIGLMGSHPVLALIALVALTVLGIAVSCITSIHPFLLGTRLGLLRLGIDAQPGHPRLLRAALGYGLAETIVVAILFLGAMALYVTVNAGAMDPSDIWQGGPLTDPATQLASEMSSNTIRFVTIASAAILLLVRAVFLPVLAGAAAGNDPGGHRHTPFSGIGHSFPAMVAMLILISVFTVFVSPLLGEVARFIGLTQLLTEQLAGWAQSGVAEGTVKWTPETIAFVILGMILTVWFISLQCAVSSLSYEARLSEVDTRVAKRAAKGYAPAPAGARVPAALQEEDEVDIGALLRARMPKQS